MAYASGIAGSPPDLNSQVNQLAKMALQSGDHMFLQQYLSPSNPNRLAAQLAQGIVQQQMQAAQTQQNLNQPRPPTVLDQKEQQLQQGMAGMPTERGMFDPSVYAQGGIGAGLGEEDQGQTQMARGGVVAFAEAGAVADKMAEYLARHPEDAAMGEKAAAEISKPQFPGEGFGKPDTPEAKLAREARIQAAQERVAARAAADAAPTAGEVTRPMPTQPAEPAVAPTKAELKAAEKVTKLDSKIEKAVLKGKDTAKLVEQRQILTEGLNAGRPAPTVAPEGIASPGPTANPTVRAVTPGAAPVEPSIAEAASQRARLNAARGKAAELGGRAIDAAVKYGKKIPFLPGMVRALPGVGTAAGLGLLAKDYVVDPLLDYTDPEGRIKESVSEGPIFRSAEAESAGRDINQPVTPEAIAELRKNRAAGAEVLPLKETLTAIRQRESGNRNLVNPLSGASGPGQMVESTFAALQKKYPELKAYSWKDYKKDSSVQDLADVSLLKDQEVTLKNMGIKPTVINHAVAWFGGPKLLTAKDDAPIDSVFSKQEIEQNPNVKGKTVGQVRSLIAAGVSGQKVARERGAGERARDFVTQAPAAVAETVGGDAAQGILPTNSPGWQEYIRNAFSPEQLASSGRTGLNAARMGTANAMEAVFGAKPTAAAATPKTAQEQYADLQKTLASQQVPERAAAVPDEFMGMDRKTLQNFLFHSGAATLGGTNQYAGVNIGKGLTAGLSAKDTMEAKREAIAAKAEEGAQNRAEKQLEANLRSVGEDIKKAIPNIDQFPGALTPLTNYAALAAMSPQQRRRVGYDDKLFAQLGKERDILMAQIKGGAGAATGAGNTTYKPTDAQQAALNKYTQ